MTIASCASQLLYEIQGPLYYNCDVTADLSGIKMEQVGEDIVRVTGVQGLPPPPTTKVGIIAPAGWQCEWHFFICGLDIVEKCRIAEDQIRYGTLSPISSFRLAHIFIGGPRLLTRTSDGRQRKALYHSEIPSERLITRRRA